MKKRALSILLSVCLLLAWFPLQPAQAVAQPSEALPSVSAAPVTPENTPEILSPADVATSGHILRLYDEEGADLNKLVYLNADGSRTLYLYDHPVKYVDADGTIRDISLDIRSLVGGAFRTAANSAVTTFSAEMSDGITLTGNSVSLQMAPILAPTPLD